ncbi:Conserved oligomeric Golgi complex subunit 6 [Candida viswanathii]|uniref:Conserved oligomeric Golgi complex subunit 6 n=1 Tax=Candida viswanathii TaxID=5486 RepID=A0A367YNL8_9ASCO|nr:Conserved oligomeric Golgi complex subunit 6 [Candida viswanathii]
MDFIDFDTFTKDTSTTEDGVLPQPQPPLSLPISSNLDQFSKKLSNFRSILAVDKPKESDLDQQTNDLMEKYAQMSINILKQEKGGDESTADNEVHDVATHNMLSTRLSRVLNDSLSDTNIREIFTNLEERFEKESECYVADLIEPGITGSISRKKFKGRIEHEIIKNQQSILKQYQPTIKQLKNIEIKLQKLNELSKETNDKINKNFEFSNDLNVEINGLNKNKQMIGLKKNLLINFKEKFTLNEYEEFVLNSGDLNDEFFEVLKRAELINENCSILLSLDNPQLGLKIIAKSNQIINRAMDRIVSYTNKTLDNLYSLNSKSRLVTLHNCFRFLQNKLNYFNSIVNTFSESRSKVLLDELYKQIQGDVEVNGQRRSSSVSSDSRPIFMSAHDPTRFVGDLLAYVHSVAVNESETITSIFTMGDDNDKEFESSIHDVTDKILRSLSRPVKARVEQIVSSETKLSTVMQIFNLVELYSIMFKKQLGDTGNLVETIKQLIQICQDRIFMIISNRLAAIKTSNLARLELNLDLQPPEWIIEFYSDILPLVDQITTETMLNLSQEENDRFLNLIINQPIEIFYEHVDQNKLFSEKRDVLLIKSNFLDLIMSKIMPVTLLTDKVLEINDMIDAMISKITELELVNMLNKCNLYDYYNIVNMICPFTDDFFEVSIYEPIKENKLYTTENFTKVDELVQEYLPNAMIEIQLTLLKLNSPIAVNEIVNNACEKFVKFFFKLNLVNQEYLQYSFTWSDLELATLLGIEEVYVQPPIDV